ncbi:universal stress protein [Maribacter aestuarii]|uniref:universal stress protein n=1 Tax=Maribacter aestuarii TaxID=1130723 RepID=UPI00248C7748|nr:universal stress protein [Maribacter aestuarii]
MKNILIPTDFSENAWNAIVYALKLFKDEECKFYLLNTYTPAIASSRFMAASFDGGVYANTAHEFSENGLKRTIAKIKKSTLTPIINSKQYHHLLCSRTKS